MDLFLHIGTEKTGTTSVQKFFKANRELLKRNGIVYPAAPGNQNHTGLAASAQDEEKRGPLRKSLGIKNRADVLRFRAEMLTELAAELSERPYKTAFMSGEHCSSRLLDDVEVQWLKDELGRFFDKMHIIVYIRRQDDYLLSTYSTSVKSGSTHPLRIPPDRTIEQRYDHWDMLQRWARVFGRDKVICRKFERATLKSGDIVDDVMDIAGIDPALGFERPEDVNEALDAETLEFLRLFNKFVPRFEGKDLNPVRDNIVPLLSKGLERAAGHPGRGRTRPVHGAFPGIERKGRGRVFRWPDLRLRQSPVQAALRQARAYAAGGLDAGAARWSCVRGCGRRSRRSSTGSPSARRETRPRLWKRGGSGAGGAGARDGHGDAADDD